MMPVSKFSSAFHPSSVSSFVAAFSDENKLDEKEIEELQSLIDEMKG